MGEYLREIERKARAFTEVDPGRFRIPGLSILYVLLALAFVVVGIVRGSVVAPVGAVLLIVAAWLWWLSDRVPYHPESRAARLFRERPEVRLGLLSMIGFFVGFFTALVGVIKQW